MRTDFEQHVALCRRLTVPNVPPRIPEPLAYHINEYIVGLAWQLGLKDWIICVNDDPPKDEEAAATMNSRRGQKFSGVWFSDDFLDAKSDRVTDELRTQICIHEVLHLHFEVAWHFVEDAVDNEFHPSARDMAHSTYKNHMEVGIDQLAVYLAPLLPQFKFPTANEEAQVEKSNEKPASTDTPFEMPELEERP